MTNIDKKTPEQIARMKELGHVLAVIVDELSKSVQAGTTPNEINKFAEALCKKNNVNPSCKGYRGYPAAVCVSINSQAVHCIPTDQTIKNGDIVSLDMVIDKDGWFADHAVTLPVGKVDKKTYDFINAAYEAREKAIDMVRIGNTIGDLGFTMESVAKRHKLNVLREMVGHGIGRAMHEAPSVPCFGKKGQGEELFAGMVITIEPMLTEGKPDLGMKDDGWSTYTLDGGRFAMFEHTVAVTENGPEILTI